MTITFSAGTDLAADFETTAVVVAAGESPVIEGIDAAFLGRRHFKGALGDKVVAPGTREGTEAVVLGIGDPSEISTAAMRGLAATLVRAAWRSRSVVLSLGDIAGPTAPAAIGQAVAEGVVLAAYHFGRYKSDPKPCEIERFHLVMSDVSGVEEAMERGAVIAGAACLARDLVNEPAAAMTPQRFVDMAESVAGENGLDLRVWDEHQAEAEGLGGLLGVGRGSVEPPRMVRLAYSPPGSDGSTPTIALVGKGITFDSGGLSLKSAGGMETMKTDMGGAAAVLGAMSALKRLGVATKVIGYMALAENMPSGRSTKPGDILRIRNGKTIEVLNTDAEGRLVLADALSLAHEDSPDAIVDLATLTGACVMALGREIAGLMGNSEALLDAVRKAGDAAGERLWPLPLPVEYKSHIDSEVADMKNIGAPGQAGALSAGLLLAEFVGDTPWAHLDIAGPARSYEDKGYEHKGGTGFGVRTLLELCSTFQPVC